MEPLDLPVQVVLRVLLEHLGHLALLEHQDLAELLVLLALLEPRDRVEPLDPRELLD